jgi:hypothetical protein
MKDNVTLLQGIEYSGSTIGLYMSPSVFVEAPARPTVMASYF